MRRLFLTISLTTIALGMLAQDITAVTVPADRTNPEFKGGQKALTIFLTKNLRYPDTAADYGVEGSVVMTFVVGVDGSLSNISAHDCKIERFNTTKFSQETESRQKELKKQFALLFAKEGARVIRKMPALLFAKEGARVIRKMPKWTPGTLNGKAVRIKFDLRISFIDPNK